MSQYGHIQGNYYLPKVKLNTLRITYLFAVFMGVEFVVLWCLSLTLSLTDTYSSLSTYNVDNSCLRSFNNTLIDTYSTFSTYTVDGSCLNSFENTLVESVIINPINLTNHCSLSTSLFTPVTYPEFVTSNPITVTNFCAIIPNLIFTVNPAPVSPPPYTQGLYQEECTGYCSQPFPSPHLESQTLTTYSILGICNNTLPNSLPPESSIPINPVDVNNFCSIHTSLFTLVTYDINYVSNLTISSFNSCLLSTSFFTAVIYDNNYINNSPITISNSCILNALPI